MNSFVKWLGRITGTGVYAIVVILAASLVLTTVLLSSAILKTADGSSLPDDSASWLTRYAAFINRTLVLPFQKTSVEVAPPQAETSPLATARDASHGHLEPDTEQHDGPGRKFGRALRRDLRAAEAQRRHTTTGMRTGARSLLFTAPCADGADVFDFETYGSEFSVKFRAREAEITLTRVNPAAPGVPTTDTTRILFEGAREVRPKPLGRFAGEYHYLLGLRSKNWVTHAPAFPALIYEDIYTDTDLVFYGSRERLEYVFLLGPDADPEEIAIQFPPGTTLPVARGDVLRVPLACGHVMQRHPYSFSAHGGRVQPGAMRFSQEERDGVVRIQALSPGALENTAEGGAFDLASYLGGIGSDQVFDVVFDALGHVYLVGETSTPNFSSHQDRSASTSDNVAAFVTKIRLADSMHVFTSFIGGRSQDRALAAAMGQDGRLWICGETLSSDFPSDPRDEGARVAEGWDGWGAALSIDGTRIERLFRVGGEGHDRCFDIDVDVDGNVWLAGETASTDLIGIPLQADSDSRLGDNDAFVVRIPAAETAPPEGVRFGGPEDDQALGIAVHSPRRAYVVGQSHSPDFFDTAPHRATYGGQGDAFLASVEVQADQLGLGRRYRFGGRNADVASAVAVSDAGLVAVVGRTASRDLNTRDAHQPTHGGGKWDGFLATVADGRVYTVGYAGGNGIDLLNDVAIDSSGNIAVVGASSSTNLALGNGVGVAHAGGIWDGFVSRYFGRMAELAWRSCVGGSGADQLYAVGLDRARNIVVAGGSGSLDVPTVHGVQMAHNGGGLDAMFSRFTVPPTHLDMRRVPAGGQPGGPDYDFYMSRYEVTSSAFARFLNDAQINTNNARGANMVFDAEGNVWMSAEQIPNRHEIFVVWDSHLEYSRQRPVGARYSVTERAPARGRTYGSHPITGVSWFGAVKYCNWLTIDSGRGLDQVCYAEGNQPAAWAPVTGELRDDGRFSSDQREALLARRGFRLPMDNCEGLLSRTNRFNEFYKAASWSGASNTVYGFGRNTLVPGDANFLDHGVIPVTETTPVGYFDAPGGEHLGDSAGNENMYAIADLSGNVSEWMTDHGGTNAGIARACYGGSYMYSMPHIKNRFFVHPHFTDPFRGMRLVSTFSEPTLTAVRVPMRICVCND